MHDKTQENQWEKFSDAELVMEGQGAKPGVAHLVLHLIQQLL